MNNLEKLLFFITPFIAWFVAGSLKFCINSLKAKSLAFKQIGYGSFPSNHMSIITSACSFAYFKLDEVSVSLTIGIAIAFIIALDATSLRRRVGDANKRINEISKNVANEFDKPLRERMGHTPFEILGGIIVGTVVGWILSLI